jgi:hypothetical protein
LCVRGCLRVWLSKFGLANLRQACTAENLREVTEGVRGEKRNASARQRCGIYAAGRLQAVPASLAWLQVATPEHIG